MAGALLSALHPVLPLLLSPGGELLLLWRLRSPSQRILLLLVLLLLLEVVLLLPCVLPHTLGPPSRMISVLVQLRILCQIQCSRSAC